MAVFFSEHCFCIGFFVHLTIFNVLLKLSMMFRYFLSFLLKVELRILFILFLVSCGSIIGLQNASKVKVIENGNALKIDFDIFDSKTKHLLGMTRSQYDDFTLLASIKQSNVSDTLIELYFPRTITYDNFEITNLSGESQKDLFAQYDYTPMFDPEISISELNPGENLIDTFNIASEFRLYLSKPDTFFIRVKKYFNDEYVFSNWDTLIVN